MTEPLAPPAPLATAGYSLRAVRAGDQDFLRRLYREVRRDEFAGLGWPEAATAALIDSQFDLQRRQYEDDHPGGEFYLVERAGTPIGRLYVDRTGPAFELVEISLLPDHRGQGLGAALIGALLDAARTGGADRVVLSVTTDNPARGLYRRLGFRETAPPSAFAEAYVEMAWTPAS